MQDETGIRVRDVLANYLAVDPAAIELHAELRRDYKLDPLALNLLAMLLEDAEGVALRPDDFTPVHTVAHLVQLVRACKARGRREIEQRVMH